MTPPARLLIGNQRRTVAIAGSQRSDVWTSHPGVSAQAIVVAAAAGAIVYGVFDFARGALIAGAVPLVLAAVNALLIVRLDLDADARTWRVVRGVRPLVATASGTFDDIHAITVVAEDVRWHVGLQPRGSGRAYDLDTFEDREAGTEEGRRLASELHLTFVPAPAPQQFSSRAPGIDGGRPPRRAAGSRSDGAAVPSPMGPAGVHRALGGHAHVRVSTAHGGWDATGAPPRASRSTTSPPSISRALAREHRAWRRCELKRPASRPPAWW